MNKLLRNLAIFSGAGFLLVAVLMVFAGLIGAVRAQMLPTPTTEAHPPTYVPPTEVPPTEVPPTEIPPTEVPPTTVPPTQVPPTQVPPTDIPPTGVPPTSVPPTETEEPQTEEPPATEPPATEPPPEKTKKPPPERDGPEPTPVSVCPDCPCPNCFGIWITTGRGVANATSVLGDEAYQKWQEDCPCDLFAWYPDNGWEWFVNLERCSFGVREKSTP